MEGLAKIAMLNEQLANIRDKKLRMEDAEKQIQEKLRKIVEEIGIQNMKEARVEKEKGNEQ